MKRKFYIDRQFGPAIWVETENGIVTNVTNEEPKFIEKMLEHYKGKPIAFLKEDFEARMKPSSHCVKPDELMSIRTREIAVESRLANLKSYIKWTANREPTKEELKTIAEYEADIYKYRVEFEAEKKILKEDLGFDWDKYLEISRNR